MVPKPGSARAVARRDDLRKWRGVKTDACIVSADPCTDGDAYGTATEACRSARVASTEFVATNFGRDGIIGCIAECENCTNDSGSNGYQRCADNDRYAEGNDRCARNPSGHDITWTDGTSNGRHDVEGLEVGHDKLVRSYELVANSFIVRRAEP